jgi:type I restriction enzyme, R subunit
MLTEGIKVTFQKDGEQRGGQVWLIDFKNIANNDFLVVNQFTVIENHNITNGPTLFVCKRHSTGGY